MTLISDTAALKDLTDRLKTADYITVDTEFMRDNSYYSRLCLIQVADDDGAFAIDPLADGLDLGPFYEIMFSEEIIKVFHACRQDMEIFFHDTGRLPVPIFDTQVAAMVCGFGEAAGYETLVKQIVGANLDKSARFTDWSRRPLSERQLEYALGDVTHLRTIYDQLSKRLEKSGRAGWVAEEMAILTDPETYRIDPKQSWKRIKFRGGNPRYLNRLQYLAEWREIEAQDRDVPRNRIVKDDVLLEIAAHPPKTPDGLGEVRGLSRGFHNSQAGQHLWTVLQQAEDVPEEKLPKMEKPKRPGQKTPPIADLLKVLLKSRCEEAGVAPKLVANSADIERIARDDGADVAALSGWRYTLFGRDALALKNGTLALSAQGSKIEIVEIEDQEQA